MFGGSNFWSSLAGWHLKWPYKYDRQWPMHCRTEIARFVQFSMRFDYGWGHKVYSLLPLVARKLGNECVVSTLASPPGPGPILTCPRTPCRQKLSSSGPSLAESLHSNIQPSESTSEPKETDKDVIPVFNLLNSPGSGGRSRRQRLSSLDLPSDSNSDSNSDAEWLCEGEVINILH